jgi:hypothetical protein
MVAVLLSTLALAMYWQAKRVVTPEQSIYRPAERIAQVLAADAALRAGDSEQGPAASLPTLPCDGRALSVLRARLLAAGGAALEQVDERIRQAGRAMNKWSGCASFMQAFDLAIAMTSMSADASGLSERQIEQALTEDLSWTRRLPCLFGRDGSKVQLLAGSALMCAGAAPELDTLASSPRGSSYRKLASITARAVSVSAAAGRLQTQGRAWLSLSSDLHAALDPWVACRQQGHCPQLPALTAQRSVSVVVMDAKSGLVLGAWCDGRACGDFARKAPGSWPATLIEAPPASTAKLLFSLALAQSAAVEPLVLQRQIKTSGQNDRSVSKRNEWWEKQAICDGGSKSSCEVPAQTMQLAETVGFNAWCDQGPASCGRWDLVQATVPSVSPGTIGRIALDKPAQKPVRMLDWNTYEAVRQGRQSQRGLIGYEPASRAVQAVLGAGDSRTSALGLALLSTQIWRLSQGLPLLAPRSLDFGAGIQPMPRQPEGQWRAAAQTVLGGMRKVVEPAEPGWQGAGTVAAALEQALGKPCKGECGVWAKTGTVSRQDKVYGGTTLLTALIDTQALAHWTNTPALLSGAGPVLTLGVIAMPESSSGQGHAASQIGMALIGQMLSKERPP